MLGIGAALFFLIIKGLRRAMIRKRLRLIGALSIALLSTSAFTCSKVPNAYHDAVVAEHDFKELVSSFQQAEIQEFKIGRIGQEEHRKLEAGIEKVGLAGATLTSALQRGNADGSVQANYTALSGAVLDLLNNGVLGIKNQTSQAILRVSVSAIQAVLNHVAELLKLPPTPLPALPSTVAVAPAS